MGLPVMTKSKLTKFISPLTMKQAAIRAAVKVAAGTHLQTHDLKSFERIPIVRYALYLVFAVTIQYYFSFVYSKPTLYEIIAKNAFNVTVLVLAELMFRKGRYQLFRLIMIWELIYFVSQFVLDIFIYDMLMIERPVRLMLYNIKMNYLLNYALFFLWSAVHLSALYQARWQKSPQIKFVIMLSLVYQLLSIIIPFNWLQIAANSMTIVTCTYYYVKSDHMLGYVNIKEYTLMAMYFLYSVLIINMALFGSINFINFSFGFNIVLLTAALIVVAKKKLLELLLWQSWYRYVMILFSLLLIFIDISFAFKLNALILFLAYTYFNWQLSRGPILTEVWNEEKIEQ